MISKNEQMAALATYYAQRAEVLEQVYEIPERQDELEALQENLDEVLADHRVLELACGTGYWTQFYAYSAESVLATDINPEMLKLARSKDLPSDKVCWELADAYDFQVDEKFSACFAGFLWSHMPRQEQDDFLQQLRHKLGKDTLLVLIDNSYVDNVSLPIARTDQAGNTYQIRRLENGERCEVMKNYPTDSALRKRLATAAREIRIERMEYYWMLTCRLK
jgi:SAM-dependent methyltransferase